MAMQENTPASAPSASVVGNAFVDQYYHILHQSPELVHKFYQDSSLLSRPDADGNMTTVTTMHSINEKILSLNYEDYAAEIKNADAQDSYEKGVIVLVTGCLTGKDNVRKKFSQTFFLAPQDKGYFVLNDVFRFVGEDDSLSDDSILVNGVNENAMPVISTEHSGQGDVSEADPSQTTAHIAVDPATSFEEEDIDNGPEVCDPSDKEGGWMIEEEVIDHQNDSIHNDMPTSIDTAPAALEDAPKKSYASIVKVMKGAAPSSFYAATTNVKVGPANSEKQPFTSAKSTYAPDAVAATGGGVPESSDVHDEVEGHSIFVRNLPFNATAGQLEEIFKRFGPIKHGGIQVRSNKQGFCFGFVEFETLSSMQSALKASPINIEDHQAIVEEKKTNTRVSSSGRGRYSGRGGFRSDSFKSRGNFGGGRGYGRNEFRNPGEFSGRPKGSAGRNGEDYQWANESGSRRGGGRQGGAKGSSVST